MMILMKSDIHFRNFCEREDIKEIRMLKIYLNYPI